MHAIEMTSYDWNYSNVDDVYSVEKVTSVDGCTPVGITHIHVAMYTYNHQFQTNQAGLEY